MKKLFLSLVFTLVSYPAYAYELLMFSNPEICGYCRNFMEETYPTYKDSIYAKQLPLKIVLTSEPPPKWFADAFEQKRIKPIQGVPLFVVWDNNKEVARMYGYNNKAQFYSDLHDFFVDNEHIFGKIGELKGRKVPRNEVERETNTNFP